MAVAFTIARGDLVAGAFALSGCVVDRPEPPSQPVADVPPVEPAVPDPMGRIPEPVRTAAAGQPTRILDPEMARRLTANTGITLQWLGWDQRGQVEVGQTSDGVYMLHGRQTANDREGSLEVQGRIVEIGADYFLLDGTVAIRNAPDAGRFCQADKLWRFGVTQGRRYWRLREFEWCDELTDYVDIYFP